MARCSHDVRIAALSARTRYTVLRWTRTIHFTIGDIVKGHEFRYADSRTVRTRRPVDSIRDAERNRNNKGKAGRALYKNVVATFCHTHAAGENVRWPERLVGRRKRIKAERNLTVNKSRTMKSGRVSSG